MSFKIIIGSKDSKDDKTETIDFKNFNLVSSLPLQKQSINVTDSPVVRKLIEYINKKISTGKPDSFKNYINPIGEMSFQQKLVLTDVFDDYDIKFLEELKTIDTGVFRDSSTLCLKLGMNCLNNKIIYYISHFYTYDEKTKQTQIENITATIIEGYKTIENKQKDDGNIKRILSTLSEEFIVKAIQTETKDSKEELDSLKTKLAQIGILDEKKNK
jgi:hypothetical protein